jgi:hypothetical protein
MEANLNRGGELMKELVGNCTKCGKEIFCLDGFFNGVHLDGNQIHCFNCVEKESKPTEQSSKKNN